MAKKIRRKSGQTETDRLRKKVERYLDAYVEHADMCILTTLHKDFGFGAKRMERFYRKIAETYREYTFYLADNDPQTYGPEERDDTWKMRMELLEAGFDYRAVVKEIQEEQKNEDIKSF